MREDFGISLAAFTTLGLGGPARRLVEVTSAAETVEVVRELDAQGEPALLLAGGSNVVIPDAGFDGTVVVIRSRGIEIDGSRPDAGQVTVAAGEPWDAFVAWCVSEGLAGVECLSGIPGSSGATPIQNVGAYGQEVAQTLVSVSVFDRRRNAEVDIPAADCGFAYRASRFKHDPRYVVLSVTFGLTASRMSSELRFGELTRVLGGTRAPIADVRDAVLALRRSKGMVLDPDDRDTCSVGSFFTNPVLSLTEWDALVARVGETPPRFPADDGFVKTSAAWLIERAGFPRGYGHDGVGLSTKHTLALTNRGAGSTAALLALAREVRAGVAERFGVTLVNEPVIVGDVL